MHDLIQYLDSKPYSIIIILLANRNILPTISTVVGPQKENPLNGAAISATDQFGILSSTPPLAGAALQRKAYGRIYVLSSL